MLPPATMLEALKRARTMTPSELRRLPLHIPEADVQAVVRGVPVSQATLEKLAINLRLATRDRQGRVTPR